MSHSILQIVKGIAKVPGDTLSAETGLDSIDLLDPLGFSTDTYEMKIPALKSSAVYADSPLTDGRTLISGALGNVNETIRVTLTAGTIVQMAAMLSKLLRFKQDCNDFWETFGQIEPVYLKHQVIGEPGPRYALLYDIDIAIDSVTNPSDPTRDLTIVIEREFGWRGQVRPGGNPKEWNCFVADTPFSVSNSSLRSGSQHTVSGTINNKQEFNGVYTFLTQNFIDIPASALPGDLPPLVCMTIIPSSGGAGLLENVLLSRVTKPVTQIDREGNTLPRYNSFAGAAGTLGTNATFVADATLGIIHTPVSPLARYVSVSFATATDAIRLTWQATSTFAHLNPNLLRGRYQVFLRGEQNAGAFGNTTVSIKMINTSGYFFESANINPKVTVANTVQLNYMGIVTIPVGSNSYSGSSGKGLTVANQYLALAQDDGNFNVELWSARSTGVATLRVYDLIFMPIDEGTVYIVPIANATGGPEAVVYDTTGYYLHGKNDIYAAGRVMDASNGLDNEIIAEPRGRLDLAPNVNNRIYILADQKTTIGSNPADTFSVFINAIPRFSGIRDV